MNPVLLFYEMPAETQRQYRLAAMRFKIRIRVVGVAEYGHTLETLLAETPLTEAPNPNPPGEMPELFGEPMLVMAGFSGPLLTAFLNFLKQRKIPRVALKAVLTETNAQWTSIQLHTELSKEREALKEGNQRGGVHSPKE